MLLYRLYFLTSYDIVFGTLPKTNRTRCVFKSLFFSVALCVCSYCSCACTQGAVNDVCVSPLGSLIASASSDHTVRLWQPTVRGHCSVLKAHAGPVHSVSFSPDGKLLVTASNDKTCKVIPTHPFLPLSLSPSLSLFLPVSKR